MIQIRKEPTGISILDTATGQKDYLTSAQRVTAINGSNQVQIYSIMSLPATYTINFADLDLVPVPADVTDAARIIANFFNNCECTITWGNILGVITDQQDLVDYIDAEIAAIPLPPPTNPAGSDGNVQYNNGGVFGGENNFFYNDSLKELTISNPTDAIRLNPTGLQWDTSGGGSFILTPPTPATDKTQVFQDADGTIALTSDIVPTDPAGSNGEIQFNNSGTFGASSNLSWDNLNKILTVNDGNGDLTQLIPKEINFVDQVGGNIRLVGDSAGLGNYTQYLQQADGTIALLSDLPTINQLVSVFTPAASGDDTVAFTAYATNQATKGHPVIVFDPNAYRLKLTGLTLGHVSFDVPWIGLGDLSGNPIIIQLSGTNVIASGSGLGNGFSLDCLANSTTTIRNPSPSVRSTGYRFANIRATGNTNPRTTLIFNECDVFCSNLEIANSSNNVDIVIEANAVLDARRVVNQNTGSWIYIDNSSVMRSNSGRSNVRLGMNRSLTPSINCVMDVNTWFNTAGTEIQVAGTSSKLVINGNNSINDLNVNMLSSAQNYTLDVPDTTVLTIDPAATKAFKFVPSWYTEKGAYEEITPDMGKIRGTSIDPIVGSLDRLSYFRNNLSTGLDSKIDVATAFTFQITDAEGRIIAPNIAGWQGTSTDYEENTPSAPYFTSNLGSISRTGNVSAAQKGYHGVTRYRINPAGTRYTMQVPAVNFDTVFNYYFYWGTIMRRLSSYNLGVEEWQTVWVLGNNPNSGSLPTQGAFIFADPSVSSNFIAVPDASVYDPLIPATFIDTGVADSGEWFWFDVEIFNNQVRLRIMDIDVNVLWSNSFAYPYGTVALTPYFKINRTVTAGGIQIDTHVMKSRLQLYTQK